MIKGTVEIIQTCRIRMGAHRRTQEQQGMGERRRGNGGYVRRADRVWLNGAPRGDLYGPGRVCMGDNGVDA